MNAQQLREKLVNLHRTNCDDLYKCAEFEEVVITMTDEQIFDMAKEMELICLQ